MTVQAATIPAGKYPAVDLAQQAFQQPQQPSPQQYQAPAYTSQAPQAQPAQKNFADQQNQPIGKGSVLCIRNAKGKPIDSDGLMIKRIMPKDEPLLFWYQRKGFNDFLVGCGFQQCICSRWHMPSSCCFSIKNAIKPLEYWPAFCCRRCHRMHPWITSLLTVKAIKQHIAGS